MKQNPIEITCPCCGRRLTIDQQGGTTIVSEAGALTTHTISTGLNGPVWEIPEGSSVWKFPLTGGELEYPPGYPPVPTIYRCGDCGNRSYSAESCAVCGGHDMQPEVGHTYTTEPHGTGDEKHD